MQHRDAETLEAALATIREAPADEGTVELVVCRPAEDVRKVLDAGELDPAFGLVGDTWNVRGSRRTDDGSPHPDMQLALVNARLMEVVSGGREDWPAAGDQLFVDLDVGAGNLPPGTRLALGSAVIEITDQPHTGCAKFRARFGADALAFVNSPAGRELRLRGIYARVVQSGTVRPGDTIRKL